MTLALFARFISQCRTVLHGGALVPRIYYSNVPPAMFMDDTLSLGDEIEKTYGNYANIERFIIEDKVKQLKQMDSFDTMKIFRSAERGLGHTMDKPFVIPSMYMKRLVGCICERDSPHIEWMELHRGPEVRCKCGYWFKLGSIQDSTRPSSPHATVSSSPGGRPRQKIVRETVTSQPRTQHSVTSPNVKTS